LSGALPFFVRLSHTVGQDKNADILLFDKLKSWQRKTVHQDFDPLTKAPEAAASSMECIEVSENFDSDKKVANEV